MKERHRHIVAALLLMLYLPLVLAMGFAHTHPVPGAEKHQTLASVPDNETASFAHSHDCIACLFAKSVLLPSFVPDSVNDEGSPFASTSYTVHSPTFPSPTAGRSPPESLRS